MKVTNIVTIEDPIEFISEGINQTQVNPGRGVTFASGLRSILRQDPNVILLGEIRDQETADIALKASITGHLLFQRCIRMAVWPPSPVWRILACLISRLLQRLFWSSASA